MIISLPPRFIQGIFFQRFSHASLNIEGKTWDLRSVPHMRNFLHVVDNDKHSLVLHVIEEFENEVMPLYSQFGKGN